MRSPVRAFRGVLHAWWFVLSVPAGVGLVLSAPTERSAFAAWIFAFSTTAMFGISALFHRTTFDDHGWYRFRRLDHVGIYVCIAGGFTPIAMMVLDGWQRVLLLVAGWVGASLGIVLRFAPLSALRDDERPVHHLGVELAADRAGDVARARGDALPVDRRRRGALHRGCTGGRRPLARPLAPHLRVSRDLAHVRRAGCHHPLHRDVGRDHSRVDEPIDGPGVGPHPEPWPDDDRLDPSLLSAGDHRNVADHYRYWRMEAIVADLDTRRFGYHVAVENWEHDFNIGTVVRNANAFTTSAVHIVGRRRWNRRGAMVTDRYQHVHHHDSVEAFVAFADDAGLSIVGIDNIDGSVPIESTLLPGLVRAGVRPGGTGAVACDAGGVGDDLRHHPVRLDPVDQCRRGQRHRHALLAPSARTLRSGRRRTRCCPRPFFRCTAEPVRGHLEEPPIMLLVSEIRRVDHVVQRHDGTNPMSEVLGTTVLLIRGEHDPVARHGGFASEVKGWDDWRVVGVEPA